MNIHVDALAIKSISHCTFLVTPHATDTLPFTGTGT